MNNYDFNSKKYIFLLIIICTLFLVLVVKTFDYLPNYMVGQDGNQIYTGSNTERTIYTDNTNEQSKDAEKEQKVEDPERHKSGHIDFFKPTQNNNNEYNITEEIKAPKGAGSEYIQISDNYSTNSIEPNDEQALKCILKAKRYKSAEDYKNAITELLKVKELTTDKELLAISYEEISDIYASNEKYNTALSFAVKANQTSPTFARDILIAKIYYRSGNAENAIKTINSALKKDYN